MAIASYYKSPNNDFTLIQGDCVETLSKFKFGFDMVFADPPYFCLVVAYLVKVVKSFVLTKGIGISLQLLKKWMHLI